LDAAGGAFAHQEDDQGLAIGILEQQETGLQPLRCVLLLFQLLTGPVGELGRALERPGEPESPEQVFLVGGGLFDSVDGAVEFHSQVGCDRIGNRGDDESRRNDIVQKLAVVVDIALFELPADIRQVGIVDRCGGAFLRARCGLGRGGDRRPAVRIAGLDADRRSARIEERVNRSASKQQKGSVGSSHLFTPRMMTEKLNCLTTRRHDGVLLVKLTEQMLQGGS